MIKKYNIFFFMVFVLFFASIPEAHADVFDRLKDLGNAMGTGLAKFGIMRRNGEVTHQMQHMTTSHSKTIDHGNDGLG